MKPSILICFAALMLAIPTPTQSASSDWLSAPKPKFPSSALKNGSEGSVRLRIVLAKDGTVVRATVLKSSGDRVLDETAQKGILKWRMKPTALGSRDLTEGRQEIIDFRQEAAIAT